MKRLPIAAAGVALIVILCGSFPSLAQVLRQPPAPFEQTAAPPAPDYSQPRAWMAFPGTNGLERSTPPGIVAVNEAKAPADVFFIHPTTYSKNDVWNAAYDAPSELNDAVLLGQLSAFNGCCRLYAPHYRQASFGALGKSQAAMNLTYSDVERAFRYYIAHENHGRPFIIASHSQGTPYAVRLLQADILGTPLQKQLVAAYTIGAYTPINFGDLGLPVCERSRQFGCVVSWNTSQTGRTEASMLIHDKPYWWRGAIRQSGTLGAVCTNPLTWTSTGAATASANLGSLPFPETSAPSGAKLAPLVPGLTGADCRDGLLDVDVPSTSEGFQDKTSRMFGSYHRSDYGLFYANIRANALDRVNAFLAAQPH